MIIIDNIITEQVRLYNAGGRQVYHRLHRVAMATFYGTFHNEGKSAQAGEGGGSRRPPLFTISTITYKVVLYMLQLRGQINFPYFSSTPIRTLWVLHIT
jgi:hypothetical protein